MILVFKVLAVIFMLIGINRTCHSGADRTKKK